MASVLPRIVEQELERLTYAYGHELFARVEQRGPLMLSPAWWDERLMGWTMQDEQVKVQLFRFIDALPLLKSPESILRHLREYFEEAGQALPAFARWAVGWMPRRGLLGRMVASLAQWNARRFARRFIAGSTVDEALQAVAAMRRKKLTFTLDLLGEATITETEAQRNQQDYFQLIEGLGPLVNAWPAVPLIDDSPYGRLPRVNVSIKLSGLFSQFDPIDPAGTTRAVGDRLRPILRSAMAHDAFVNVDMEQHAFKDLTLHIFQTILQESEFRDWPHVGIAIQAYLQDVETDLHQLADWARKRGTPVWVRLVKGAYWDYENVVAAQEDWPLPVFPHKWQTDAAYERMTRFLLDNRDALRPAFGSHNIRSLAHALATAHLLEVPQGAFEIQMLYGMADPIKDALVRLGQRVRVYTPYGQLLPGMAYLVRRLLENTANDSFLRASFAEHVPEEKLLMKPSGVRGQGSGASQGMSAVSGPPSAAAGGLSHAADGGPLTADHFKNEPLLDFSREEHRQALAAALAEVKKQLGKNYPLVIENKEVPPAEWMESTNPSHVREVVGRCGQATVEQAQQAVAAATKAFGPWRDRTMEDRAKLLEKAASIMQQRRWELAAWEVYECGKPWREADADVAEAVDFCRYYALQGRRLATPQAVDVAGERNRTFYEPRGVAVVIAPWNFPLAILCGMTTAALVTGNTVVMKPAEQSSVIAAKFMEILRDAGFPPGVVNYLPGVGEEIGPTLAEHPDVALVAFTGSRGVGMLLNRQTAELAPGQTHIKKLIAELGGKNAIIVDDDADLDEAVVGTVASAFGYAGQKCSACSRVIVLEAVYETFVHRLIEATRSLRVAPAEDPGCKVGPVIDGEARQRILEYVEKGKHESRLAFAADLGFLVNEGHYVAPHIFVDVRPDTAIAQEEIFGPVLAVLKVKDLDEALRVANGTAYALTGGLFSRSPEHIQRVQNEFRVGNLYINRKITGALVRRQPFGGFKLSGVGSKAGGPDYLLQFVLPRTITENTMRRGFAPNFEGQDRHSEQF